MYKSDVKKELELAFKEEEHKAIKEKMVSGLKKWAFMIVDPFDKTYNPGKQIFFMAKEGAISAYDDYKRAMYLSYMKLEKHGSLSFLTDKI